MKRLHVIAEGQTEERAVRNVIAPYLGAFSVYADARSVETSRRKTRHAPKGAIPGNIFRGGLLNYQQARADIVRWMKEDRSDDCLFTTMFDLYALPGDFPGRNEASKIADPYEKVRLLESAFADDVEDRRFIPYVQLHEFEALIFVNPRELTGMYFEHETDIRQLIEIAENFENPELIDEGAETAPSKRIFQKIPEYDKATVGPAVIEKIGIEKLRDRCPHLKEWLDRLKAHANVN